MSAIRQQYHVSTENAVNEQINAVLRASYTYLKLAFYFDRDDVALGNLHKHFLHMSEKKKEMYEKLMKYQNVRGGRIILQTVQRPEQEFASAAEALQVSLQLERSLNENFIALHGIADTTNDAHFSDFVEEALLDTQVAEVKAISDLLSNCQKAGEGLGEYMFDKELED
uniref:Ferritin n=1 Tax=Steinernema glaseri TaxID=37863 RepID=A0A1I7Z6M0_9BILA